MLMVSLRPIKRLPKKMGVVREQKNVINSMLRRKHMTGYFTAQPVHVNLDEEIVGSRKIKEYLIDRAIKQLRDWGVTDVFADDKYKGVRVVMFLDKKNGIVEMYSRSGKKKTYEKFVKKFGDLFLKEAPDEPVILDGEMLALSKRGIPQGDITGFVRNPEDKPYRPQYRVFDILYYGNKDLREQPLLLRRELLRDIVEDGKYIRLVRYSQHSVNDKKGLLKRLDEASRDNEGLVIKDVSQPYIQNKGGGLHWIKAKLFDNPDLELKAVNAWPKDKPFRFYKHWELVPVDDEEHVIKVDKGFDGMGFDWDFYEQFTKQILDKLDKKELRASRDLVVVDKDFVTIYNRKKVPRRIVLPKGERPIVEILVDDMTKDLLPSGQKILAIRVDKEKADDKKRLKQIYKLFVLRRKSDAG